MEEAPPTFEEISLYKLTDDYERCWRMIGSDYVARAISRAMFLWRDPWTLRGLSDYLGYSRDVIRVRVTRSCRVGWMARDGGYTLTPMGRTWCLRLHREVADICMARRVGFSEEAIAFCRDVLQHKVDVRAARSVTLHQKIPYHM